MRLLIFDSEITGHLLEYMHHLYDGVCNKGGYDVYILTTLEYNDVKDKFEWQETDNIHFLFLNDEELKNCTKPNLLLAAWWKSLVIRKYVEKYDIDKVWLIMLMLTMPFLPFILPRKCKITGVLYRLFFYESTPIKGFRKILEHIRYQILAHHHCVEKVLVLNDELGANKLNEMYRTNRFKYIPDPVPDVDMSKVHDLRDELYIPKANKIFLHFGALNERKGTLLILEAIKMMHEDDLKAKTFIFAGKVSKNLHERFYILIGEISEKVQVLVFDEFCSYEFLNNLCYSCDNIVIPYQNANQSSGVIGYASVFNKPVIGPGKGLIGRILKDYNMGIGLETLSIDTLKESFSFTIMLDKPSYQKTHTVNEFTKVFLSL